MLIRPVENKKNAPTPRQSEDCREDISAFKLYNDSKEDAEKLYNKMKPHDAQYYLDHLQYHYNIISKG